MIRQPYYTIDFTAIYCKFEILVNDIPIICLETDGQMSPNVPINFGIPLSGKQKLEINIFPVSGQNFIDEKTKIEYTIRLFDVFGNNFNHIKDCVTNKILLEKGKKLPSFKHNTFFEAEVPYTLNTYESSKDLTIFLKNDRDKLFNKLDAIYKKISDCFVNKKYDTLYEIIKEREQNMADSMYLTDIDSRARFNSIIEDAENGFLPMPLPLDKVLKIYGNGKLATYKKTNGEPAFFLYNKNTKEELMLDLIFHIPKGKEEFWVI